MKVSIIGAGNMARAIGTRVIAGGNSVKFFARESEEVKALVDELGQKLKGRATVTSAHMGEPMTDDVVILAIPYAALSSVANDYGSQLKGKVVVDITNPVNFQTFDLLTTTGNSSAEQLAKLLPESKVVKAFNIAFAPTLTNGKVAGQALDIFIAGDDKEAKSLVANLAKGGGLRPVDIGGLKYAHQLEASMLVHMLAQKPLGTNFTTAIKILT